MSIMRISHGRVRPGSWDEYEATYRALTGEVDEVDGLIARSISRDLGDTDAGYSISIWRDEAAIDAYEASDRRRQVSAALKDFYVGNYETRRTDLRVWRDRDSSSRF